MAKKKVYRFWNHCHPVPVSFREGKDKEQRVPIIRSQSLPWQRCSQGARVAPQRCPILLRALRFYHHGLFLPLDGFSL
jgi:hypothetical protein